MAELLVARITVRLAWQLFAPKTASVLQDGDVAEEKLRQLLLSEFQKIHEHLNALRRKELVSAVAFLETGFGLLNNDKITAKTEFSKARNAAQMAFGVVADYKDKVLATKILVTSTFHEFDDNFETAQALCIRYMERLNSLAEVTKASEVIFSPEQKLTNKMFSMGGKEKREELLAGVAEINKCVYDFLKLNLKEALNFVPLIRFGQYHINPVFDMVVYRTPNVICEIDKSNAGFIAVTIAAQHVFAALGQSPGSAALTHIQSSILCINIDTGKTFHLLGHKAVVLDLCSNEQYLFSASYDKDVIVWDLQHFQPLVVLSQHQGSVRSLCVSAEYLFTASADNTIKVWEIEAFGSEKGTLPYRDLAISYPVTKVVCSRRKFLFVGTGANQIEIWDMKNFEKLHSFQINYQVLNIIASDNSMFVPVKKISEEMILVYNLGSLTLSSTLKEKGRVVDKFYNSPYIYTTGVEHIRMVSTTSERLIYEKTIKVFKQIVCDEIKFIVAHQNELYVFCEQKETSRNFLVKL